MATVTLHHNDNHNPFRKLAHAVNNALHNTMTDLHQIAKDKKRQANVILKKLSGRDVTKYLLHASYEGFKQNLQGADIDIEYLLLTSRIYLATAQEVSAKPFGLIAQARHKIISSLNRLKIDTIKQL